MNDDGVEFEGVLIVGQVVFEVEQVKGAVYPIIHPRNDWCITVEVKLFFIHLCTTRVTEMLI